MTVASTVDKVATLPRAKLGERIGEVTDTNMLAPHALLWYSAA